MSNLKLICVQKREGGNEAIVLLTNNQNLLLLALRLVLWSSFTYTFFSSLFVCVMFNLLCLCVLVVGVGFHF